MTDKTAKFEIGSLVRFKGEVYYVAGYESGWYELTTDDGETAKARAKSMTAVEEDHGRMAEVMAEHKKNYVTQRSYAGNSSQSNGDLVATYFLGDDPQHSCAKAEALLGLEPGSLYERYNHLNAGQIRMNAGNKIRGALKRGDIVEDQLV